MHCWIRPHQMIWCTNVVAYSLEKNGNRNKTILQVNNQTEFSKRTTSGFPNEEDHSDEVTTFFYEYFDFPEEMPKLEPTESTLEKNFAGKDE